MNWLEVNLPKCGIDARSEPFQAFEQRLTRTSEIEPDVTISIKLTAWRDSDTVLDEMRFCVGEL